MKAIGSGIKKYIKNIDILILVLAIAATAIGLVLIYSATRSYHTDRYVEIQFFAFLVGLFAFLVLSLMDLEHLSVLWKWVFLFNVLIIGSLFFLGVGEEEVGNNSWIRFGSIGIQPAEVGKLLFIFTLSAHINLLKEKLSRLSSFIVLIVHAMIMVACVYFFSKDLGMALSYIFIFAAMLFASGVKLRYLLAGLALIAGALPVVWNHLLAPFQKMRILVVFDPTLDPDIAYHAEQSKIALGAGGVTGRGYMEGFQTQYGLLPTKHTDFIFSVAGEEFGFLGCMVIIAVLSLLIVRVFYVAYRTHTVFQYLICMGIASMFLFQTFLNIGMCLGVVPVIGLTLPFISYGGSSLMTMFAAIGMVAGIRMRNRAGWDLQRAGMRHNRHDF